MCFNKIEKNDNLELLSKNMRIKNFEFIFYARFCANFIVLTSKPLEDILHFKNVKRGRFGPLKYLELEIHDWEPNLNELIRSHEIGCLGHSRIVI